MDGAPISVGRSAVSTMSLMPTAMPRNGPLVCAFGFLVRFTNALIVPSCASIAANDSANAASGVSLPCSMRRSWSASEIIGVFLRHVRVIPDSSVFVGPKPYQDVDGGDKPGHDDGWVARAPGPPSPRSQVDPFSRYLRSQRGRYFDQHQSDRRRAHRPLAA